MIDVFAAAVAADVGDAALVVVGGGHAGVAVGAAVVLAGAHEGGEVGVGCFGGWRHAVVGVVGVGDEGWGWWEWWVDRGVRVGCLGLGMILSWWGCLLGCWRCCIAVFTEIVHGGRPGSVAAMGEVGLLRVGSIYVATCDEWLCPYR